MSDWCLQVSQALMLDEEPYPLSKEQDNIQGYSAYLADIPEELELGDPPGKGLVYIVQVSLGQVSQCMSMWSLVCPYLPIV